MTWVKLDDGFYRHAKARAAGKDGRALFVASLCWCAANGTNGLVHDYDLPVLAAEADVKGPATARRLVDVGLWFKDQCDEDGEPLPCVLVDAWVDVEGGAS